MRLAVEEQRHTIFHPEEQALWVSQSGIGEIPKIGEGGFTEDALRFFHLHRILHKRMPD